MEFLFWILIGAVFYCYFGYPLLLAGCARLFSRPVQKSALEPMVSVILSVHNEEDVIARKLENIFSLDYPQAKLEVLIGSDASADQTNSIINGQTRANLKFFPFQERRGKMLVLNDLVVQANGEILVFMDARQRWEPQAIRELVANFSDPQVGCVSGELMFEDVKGVTAEGVGAYWKYEKALRRWESQIHSMLGATGAIYALRKSLYQPVPREVVLDDMFVPLKAIESGYRAIFDQTARAWDRPASDSAEEHRRKARTLFGNYQIFGLFFRLFWPWRSPVAIQLFSHKFLRVLMPLVLILIVFLNLLLFPNPFYRNILWLQGIFYGMAFLGSLAKNDKYVILSPIRKLCYLPYMFCLLNFSALTGLWRFLSARQNVTWEKARKTAHE